MSDLNFPTENNWKRGETDRDAAACAAEKAPIWRARCLRVVAAAPNGLTACEVAAILDHDVASTRPRITELAKLKKVEPTGERRRTRLGATAIVWRAVEAA
jgi:hypothetical protein